MRTRVSFVVIMAVGLMTAAGLAQNASEGAIDRPAPQGMDLDLTKGFQTRSPWRLVVTEGPQVKDYGDADAPGALTLCLYKGVDGPCVSSPVTLPLQPPTPDYAIAWEPHYLETAKLVYPNGPKAAPFLLIVTGSLYSGDGDQLVSTQLVSYDADRDTFRRFYGKSTGHNNNQEIRFISDGPLRGSIISAEPQEHLPYGYWIVVDKLMPTGAYRQVLRYGSATLYNDGNPLAVIDSEMPNIEMRLGLWKPGEPLPAPRLGGNGKPCLNPTLKHTELWCE
jgi:hypothetical protein